MTHDANSRGLNRRDVLKAAAVAAATATAARLSATRDAHANPEPTTPVAAPATDDVRWDKAPCRFCGTGCHVRVGVSDGRVVAIQGDTEAAVNKGLLCVKGYHVGLAL